MTTALKQFFRDLVSVLYDMGASLLRVVRRFWWVGFLAYVVYGIFAPICLLCSPEEEAALLNRQARSEETKKQNTQLKHELCVEAKACKKYSEARLECATAGNFKTCLRIKMGEDSFYSDMCSGYDLGAPAVPPLPETPTAFECFFLTLWR